MSAVERLRWGLIGASDVAATRMIPALRDAGQEIVAIYSSSSERAKAFGAEHSVPLPVWDLERLLEAPVDAVYISSLNTLHREQAEAAARAGKHILCEKPLTTSPADAAAIVRTCSACDVVLATNHHQRNAATVRAVADLVAGGTIGQPLAARVQHGVLLPERLRRWRVASADHGSGVTLDLTSHAIDTLRFVLGRNALEAVGFNARHRLATEAVEDTAMGLLRFEDDVLASTHDSFATPEARTALEVHGTQGSIVADGVLSQEPVGDVVLRRDHRATVIDVGPRESLYVRGVQDFVSVVTGGLSPIATGEDGFHAVAGAVAVLEAARQGRTVPVASLGSHSS